MMKHIDWEQPHIQQVFGQAIWNPEKGAWEVTLTLTDMVHTNLKEYLTVQTNFEVDVEACDEFVLPTAIIQANGFRAEEILEGTVITNTKRDGIETEY
jgi:hypothetical protein